MTLVTSFCIYELLYPNLKLDTGLEMKIGIKNAIILSDMLLA